MSAVTQYANVRKVLTLSHRGWVRELPRERFWKGLGRGELDLLLGLSPGLWMSLHLDVHAD